MPAVQNRPKQLIRPSQAAARLGVSLPTFWRYARTNPHFPPVVKLSPRVSGVWDDALDAFILAPSFAQKSEAA